MKENIASIRAIRFTQLPAQIYHWTAPTMTTFCQGLHKNKTARWLAAFMAAWMVQTGMQAAPLPFFPGGHNALPQPTGTVPITLPIAGTLQHLPQTLPAAATSANVLGHLTGTNLNLAIALPLRNQTELSRLLGEIYDPSSSQFRQFLTPAQFADRFGPTEQDYQKLITFARKSGLVITATHPNRTLLDVQGSVPAIEHAFHVRMQEYQHPTENRKFFAPDVPPAVDLDISVLGISGLDNFFTPRPRLVSKPITANANGAPNASPTTGSGPGGTFMGYDFRHAYVPGTTATGTGQIVGLFQLDGYRAGDISYYESKAGLPSVTLSNVLLDGVSGQPDGSGADVEVCLDIEDSISMAPGLSEVLVYEGSAWHDILNRMATDDLAKQLSCSWYIPGGGPDPVADQIWEQMAAQGQSFFNASGDSDAYTGPISFPGDTPYITQVGGTTLTTTGPQGSWVAETVWNWGGGVGSSGGVSTSYPIPSWQTNINMSTNLGSATLRNTPDVALTADNVYVRSDGADNDVGGTSCAAPLWAGFMALVNQTALTNGEPVVGFINPKVYALGFRADYTNIFHDIITGNNERSGSGAKFPSTPGYDLCTGWGTPTTNLIYALGVPEPLRISPSAPLIFTGPAGGPINPLTSNTFALYDTAATSFNWTLVNTSSWFNVSSTSGTLSATSGPAIVTLSLTATATTLPAGTYPVTLLFTNLNDNFGQGRQVILDVVTQPVITSQPQSQAVLEGSTATFNIGTAPNSLQFYQWQLDTGSGPTNLTDRGNISGSATSTLTISGVSATNVGNYSVIITNAAGTTNSMDAALSITPSQPVITLQPAPQTVLPGAPAAFSVAAIGTHPFGYQWQINGTNLVNGPNLSGATTNLLTINSATTANLGAYSVIISNSLGSTASSNAALNLISVTAPGVALTTLFSPTNSTTYGENSYSQLVQAGDGNFYGTMFQGGANGFGTLFRLATNGTFTVLIQFNYSAGGEPYGGLILGRDGYMYGTTGVGGTAGYGVVFRLSTNGAYTVLGSFNDANGFLPVANLMQGADGNLYGTTVYGGLFGDGNIFRVTTSGVISNLFSFNGLNGVEPSCALVQDANGNFYGTTELGGRNGDGTIFKLSPAGQLTTLVAFNYFQNGAEPIPGLTFDTDGNLYGTTYAGGTNGFGTIFKLAPNGTLTTLYQFTGANDGGYPFGGLLLGADGNLYGTTSSGGTYSDGTIFEISPAGSFTTLAELDGFQGAEPLATLAQGFDGSFYGITAIGGSGGYGSCFRMDISGALQITTQPANQTAYTGNTVAFNVATFGGGPVSYQWQENGTNLANGVNISGATARILTLTNVTAANASTYSVIVSNSLNSLASSNATLTVIDSIPVITAQPAGTTVLAGSGAVFTVQAQGDAPLVYQWQENGINLTDGGRISGSQTANLFISATVTNDSGIYSVTVSNFLGGAQSSNAVLAVVPAVASGFSLGLSHTFKGGAGGDGGNPYAGLIQATNGSLFGTTANGGTSGYGTIYKTTTAGGYALGYSFTDGSDGAYPYASLFQATNGLLYGTTTAAGSNSVGNIYSLSVTGAFARGYSFTGGNDGSTPYDHLVQDAAGNFYGTTLQGGSNSLGSIFIMSPAGVVTPFHSFSGTKDGANPYSWLLRGPDGSFFGTTAYGGASGYGTVFNITTNGTFTLLHSFNNTDGATPVAGLVLGNDGNLYGTTFGGGTNGYGTVFTITTNGAFTSLYSFSYTDGAQPFAGLVQGADGNLYGTTELGGVGSGGTVFQITTNRTLNTVIWFNGANGAYPAGTLIQAANAYFYGTTYYGGASNSGTIFDFTVPMAPLITTQPADITTFAGNNVAFSVAVTGTTPLTYQWQWNGTNLVDGGNISGSHTSQLNVNNVSTTADGNYSVLVTNIYGSALSSNATLVVTLIPPSFVSQSTNQTVWAGTNLTLSVSVTGSSPFGFQWQFSNGGAPINLIDGGNISGSATANLNIANISLADAGTYFAVVTNLVGSATTNAVVTVLPIIAPGYTLTTYPAFASSIGGNPNGLVLGTNGNLYGTTQTGGTNSKGSVFEVLPDGVFSNLYSFTGGSDGSTPHAALVQGPDGNFYGTVALGGANARGTLFQFTGNNTFNLIFSFTTTTNGFRPYSPLILGPDGRFYGTTLLGGTNITTGATFVVSPTGAFSNLCFLGKSTGSVPYSPLALGTDGNFYGTASAGGANGDGTVFQLTTNGSVNVLYTFTGAEDGGTPHAGLIQASDGNFYGTTTIGGTGGGGTVFRITTNGTLTTLFTLGSTNGSAPDASLLQAPDGSFYGSTSSGGYGGNGSIFNFTTNGTFTNIVTFTGANGASPQAPLVLGADGALYGTTFSGGISNNGTVFRLALPVPPLPPSLQYQGQRGSYQITWNAAPGRVFQLQYSPSLNSPNWANIGGPITATTTNVTVNLGGAGAQGFYRLQLIQ